MRCLYCGRFSKYLGMEKAGWHPQLLLYKWNCSKCGLCKDF